MLSPNGQAALAYAAKGWKVLPVHSIRIVGGNRECSCGSASCKSPGKHPKLAGGVKDASNDPVKIRSWWNTSPDANIALATGRASGVIVLDLDGAAAMDSVAEHALELPENTPKVKTGKGMHIYLKAPEGTTPNFVSKLPGIDLRGDGGYVLMPPSTHISGKNYEWLDSSQDTPLEYTPGWLYDLIDAQASPAGLSMPEKITAGERNDTLARMAGFLRRKNISLVAIVAALMAENLEKCDPPLSAAEVQIIAESMTKYKPEVETEEIELQDDAEELPKKGTIPVVTKMSGDGEYFTDIGNTKKFLHAYGQDIMYVADFGQWYQWNGITWRADVSANVNRLAHAVPETLIVQDAAREPRKKQKAEIFAHALATQNAGRINAMVELAKVQKTVESKFLDADGNLLGVANGVVNLETGQLLSPERYMLITKSSDYNFVPDAACPTWITFMNEIMGENTEMVRWLQKALGYSITGRTDEQCFFICYGIGANGKSTMLETIKAIIAENAATANFGTFLMQKASTGANEDVARLVGTRFVTATESNADAWLNEAVLKQMTGGDAVTARFLYQKSFTFTPRFKLWMASNSKPGIKGTDEGIWRRIRLIPFKVTIPEEKRDAKLKEKLLLEAEGILAWLVQGAKMWYAERLGQPEEVREASSIYRKEADIFGQFLEEYCVLGGETEVLQQALFDAYSSYCSMTKEDAGTSRAFGKRLDDRGVAKLRKSGMTFRTGIDLKPTVHALMQYNSRPHSQDESVFSRMTMVGEE